MHSGEGGEQNLRVGVAGFPEQGVRLRLLNDTPHVHHADPMRNVPHHAEVMGDEKEAQGQVLEITN